MAEIFTGRKRIRKKFGTIGEVAEMPNLIELTAHQQTACASAPPT